MADLCCYQGQDGILGRGALEVAVDMPSPLGAWRPTLSPAARCAHGPDWPLNYPSRFPNFEDFHFPPRTKRNTPSQKYLPSPSSRGDRLQGRQRGP